MVEFLLLESDRERAERIRAALKALFLREKRSYTLTTQYNYEDALKLVERSPEKYDVALVCMNDEAAARSVAAEVRRHSLRAAIVLYGGGPVSLLRLLPVRPSAYFADPAASNSFDKIILALYLEQTRLKAPSANDRYFLVRNRGELERIPYGHIDYFESMNRKIYLHCNRDQRVYEFNDKIDSILAAINAPEFIRCHQSIVVNLANVLRIDKNARQCIMLSGTAVDISKRNVGEVAELFEKYTLKSK